MNTRIIEVIDYDISWPEKFKAEKDLISSALSSDNLVAVHHIGSTSVPGLAAKPIIDILLEVENLEVLDKESTEMEKSGYLVKGEFGIPGRRYFQKGGIQRSHQVHSFIKGSEEIKRHLAFRDYLRAHPNIRDEYADLKKYAAAQCDNNIERYMAFKNDFITRVESEALAWIA